MVQEQISSGSGSKQKLPLEIRIQQFEGGVNVWVVENVNGDESLVKKEFETYQEAKAYAEWTLGTVCYVETQHLERTVANEN